MTCRASLLVCVFMIALLVTDRASAQTSEQSRMRYSFSGEDAPPYIHFRFFLIRLHAGPDPEWTNSQLSDLGFADAEMPEALAYFSDLKIQMDSEVDSTIARVACFSGAENLGGVAIRTIYNSFDDIRFAYAAKYVSIAAAELAVWGHTDFVERLVVLNDSFSTDSSNHLLLWGDNDIEIQRNRAAICQGIKERMQAA